MLVKITSLKIGDRVRYTWAPGNFAEGVITFVVPRASKASKTVMYTDQGQRMKLHHMGKIELLS